jgi:hypothetical protein
MAIQDPGGFTKLVDTAKAQIERIQLERRLE